MTTTTPTVSAAADRSSVSPEWLLLARIEMIRYARRPAFLFGAALTLAALLPYLDPAEPVDELAMIAPATLIGLFVITLSSVAAGMSPFRWTSPAGTSMVAATSPPSRSWMGSAVSSPPRGPSTTLSASLSVG